MLLILHLPVGLNLDPLAASQDVMIYSRRFELHQVSRSLVLGGDMTYILFIFCSPDIVFDEILSVNNYLILISIPVAKHLKCRPQTRKLCPSFVLYSQPIRLSVTNRVNASNIAAVYPL